MLNRFKKAGIVLLTILLIMGTAFDSYADINNFDNVVAAYQNKVIGVESGSASVEYALKWFPDAKISYFDTAALATAALQNGNIDVVVETEPILSVANSVKHEFEIYASADDYEIVAPGFAQNEKGETLKHQYNEFIRKLRSNSEYEQLIEKWMGDDDSVKTIRDFEYSGENGTITIGTDPEYQPFQYISDGKLVGFESEIVMMFCEEYGYKPDFQYADFTGVLSGVRGAKFDAGFSGLAVTPEREEYINFGDSLYESHMAIAIRDRNAGKSNIFVQIAKGFKDTFITEARWKLFMTGLSATLSISLSSLLLGTILGFVAYLLTRNNYKIAIWITKLCKGVIHVFPMVVILMVFFYIIFSGSKVSGTWIAIIAFTVTFACTLHEMLETGEKLVGKGQIEAAYSLGYNKFKTFRVFILPETIQYMLPILNDSLIDHIKGTAIVGYIAVVDITKVSDIIVGRTYDAFFPLIAVSAVYGLLALIIRIVLKFVTDSTNRRRRSHDQILKGLVIK